MSDIEKKKEELTTNTPVDLTHLGVQKEIQDIVQEYLPQVRDWLDVVAARDPDKAIKLVLEMVEFIEPKKSKGVQPPSNTNIQIVLTPAKESDVKQTDTINISKENDK